MASKGQRGDDDSVQSTRNRILLAAGPIFAAKGFRKSTVREICEEANVNVASVNYYFGDKKNLYLESVLLARQMRADQFPGPVWTTETGPEKLRQFVALILKRMVVNAAGPWQVQLLMNEIQNPTDTCEQLVEEYFRPFMETLIEIIIEVAQRDIAKLTATQLALNVVGQCMIYRFAPQTQTLTLGNVFEDGVGQGVKTPDQPSENATDPLDALADLITKFSIGGIQHATGDLIPP